MSTQRARTAKALPGTPERGAVANWGAWLALTALTTGVGGFAAAALYLHSGQPAWPPEGIEEPTVTRAVAALLAGTLTWALTGLARRFLCRGSGELVAAWLFLAVVAGIAAVWGLIWDLSRVTFRWDDHAYASVYWTLTGTPALLFGVGVLMVGATLMQRLTGVLDQRRMLELEVTHIYLTFSVFAATVCLTLAHLLPNPASGP